MGSKIEKLERVKVNQLKGMMGEVAPQWVAKELNKIIDYLNTQPQAEDCTHSFDLNNRCSRCGVRGVKDVIAELQDTPEQKEEWEEVNKDIWYMVGGKKYVNINGEEYVRTSDIEKLLSKLTTK